MRHDLKHIKTVTKTLRSGERVTYYYHRRTGKRIAAEPGTDAFLDAYRAASTYDGPTPGTLGALIAQYQADDAYQMLRDRTRADYGPILSALAAEFGNAPLMAFEDPRMRRDVRAYRDRLAQRSPRQADYAISVLSSLLKYGCDDGQLSVNLAATIRRVYKSDRADRIWTDADVAAMDAACNVSLRAALYLALDTGQREGDLIALPLSAYRDGRISYRQSKTGRWVDVPLTDRAQGAVRALLDHRDGLGTKTPAMTILTGMKGRPWTQGGFVKSWQKAAIRAGVHGRLTFHDLRGTLVTRLHERGASHAEIASITGHSLRAVEAIIDQYTARTRVLADRAIARIR